MQLGGRRGPPEGRAVVNRVDMPAPFLPQGRPNLVVTGFMATGKTTSGRLAAERLGLPFIDLDGVAEQRLGTSIADAFQRDGEERFRDLERALLRSATALSATVVATGGGAVMSPDFAGLARDSEVAVLTAMTEDLEARLGDATARPLLFPDPRVRIQELLDARSSAYSDAGEAVATTGRSPEEVADELATRVATASAARPIRIDVRSPGHGPMLLGDGAIAALGAEVRTALPDARTAAMVVDPGAAAIAEEVESALGDLRITRIGLPAGEGAKSHEVLGRIWAELRAAGIERSDVVVAVGGGAALDVAGFAAATYARGVALVNVPTTLLAMVDAGLGGKTAVDHAGAKNLAGVFHAPTLVAADPATLRSLPEDELRSGMGEVVKAAVLASPLMLDVLADRDPPTDWLLEQAIRIKAGYVAADPADRGVRASLNLGHTFAHAVESVTGYAIRHGEAVAIGLIAAARLGTLHGVTDPALEDRIRAALERLGLPTSPPPGLDPAALAEAMGADKKRRSGLGAFVVPADDGAALLQGIDPTEAVESLLRAEASA
jgi:3-dehydroquinate synthetase